MLSNRKEIHVEWGDCDPAGIVYYPRFFEYFDACTNALFEKAGLKKAETLKAYGLLGIPMVDTRGRFYTPASFGETVTVETRIVEWGRSSFQVEHKLYNREVLAAECSEKRVWTVRDSQARNGMRGEAIPDEVKARFACRCGGEFFGERGDSWKKRQLGRRTPYAAHPIRLFNMPVGLFCQGFELISTGSWSLKVK